MSPYVEVHGDLESLFDAGPWTAGMKDIADDMTDLGHDVIVANTPVESGNLRSSWRRQPRGVRFTVRGLARGWEGRVVTDVAYAPYVEEGTGLYGPRRRSYVIEPKAGSFLRWRDPVTGEWVTQRRVVHPGSRGAHMTKIAAAYVEASVDEIALPVIERIRVEVGRTTRTVGR